jgi:hypothetical protein
MGSRTFPTCQQRLHVVADESLGQFVMLCRVGARLHLVVSVCLDQKNLGRLRDVLRMTRPSCVVTKSAAGPC